MYFGLAEYLLKWGAQDKLCGLIPLHVLRQVFYQQPHALASLPVIEVKGSLAAIAQFQIPITHCSAENNLNTILKACAALCNAVERVAVDILYLQNSPRFICGADPDRKAGAEMTVYLTGFPVQLMNHILPSVFQ